MGPLQLLLSLLIRSDIGVVQIMGTRTERENYTDRYPVQPAVPTICRHLAVSQTYRTVAIKSAVSELDDSALLGSPCA